MDLWIRILQVSIDKCNKFSSSPSPSNVNLDQRILVGSGRVKLKFVMRMLCFDIAEDGFYMHG